MSKIRFIAMPSTHARALQRGGLDAYGFVPERRRSDGSDIPCRHCLKSVAEREDYLVLAYRPFTSLQPYAETGPVFLHAAECERAREDGDMPVMFRQTPDYILRGYDGDERIVYGTGSIVPTPQLATHAAALFERPDVTFVHMRSARNNCFQCRIERG